MTTDHISFQYFIQMKAAGSMSTTIIDALLVQGIGQ